MPTITRRGAKWRAQVRRLGHPPQSRTFHSKADATAWAIQMERELLDGHLPTTKTLGDAFQAYAKAVSPTKRGERWEKVRLEALEGSTMARKPISRLTEDDIAKWRDERLQAVSGPSVRREMNLIQSVLETARKEWRWITRNPILDVKKPASRPPRRKGVPAGAVDAICAHLTGDVGRHVAAAFRFAIETGMRAGEILSLEWSRVDLDQRVASLPKTKNEDAREVPLSSVAVAILEGQKGNVKPFPITAASLDRLFRKARDKTEWTGVHFHDSRSEAISRLSKKLDVLELARVVGHRDIRSLMFYYRASAAELAMKLD